MAVRWEKGYPTDILGLLAPAILFVRGADGQKPGYRLLFP